MWLSQIDSSRERPAERREPASSLAQKVYSRCNEKYVDVDTRVFFLFRRRSLRNLPLLPPYANAEMSCIAFVSEREKEMSAHFGLRLAHS